MMYIGRQQNTTKIFWVLSPKIWAQNYLSTSSFFKESTPLNGLFRNFNTRRASVGNKTLRKYFGYCPTKFQDPKTTYFRQLRNSVANLTANVSGDERDRDSRETALETTSSQNFKNFGPLTAKTGPSLLTLTL